MKLAAHFSFADGEKVINRDYAKQLAEITKAITAVDGHKCRTKVSREKTMKNRRLFSPVQLNKAFKAELEPHGWRNCKVACDYSQEFYRPDYTTGRATRGAYRDMDFVKDKLGVEVQLGKYAFMVYNVCAKMTIFRNLGHIAAGIEIVPVKSLAEQMSTGVSYFEQFVWDLQQRGRADIDVPVLILGIDA
jgi:Restriction endonuclease BglII